MRPETIVNVEPATESTSDLRNTVYVTDAEFITRGAVHVRDDTVALDADTVGAASNSGATILA